MRVTLPPTFCSYLPPPPHSPPGPVISLPLISLIRVTGITLRILLSRGSSVESRMKTVHIFPRKILGCGAVLYSRVIPGSIFLLKYVEFFFSVIVIDVYVNVGR